MEKPDSDFANVYILRAPNPSLGLYKFEINIERFTGHFKNSKALPYKKLQIDNSEYCFLKLEESYYNIKISKEEHPKILFAEKGKEYYFNIEIFSEKVFSLPEFFLRKISKEEALRNLLAHNKMETCRNSIKF